MRKQEALDKAGHKHKLVYEKVDIHSLNKKKKQRKRKVIYFVPPFDRRVKTKIGKQFLQILDKTIPKGHILYPALNRHTVKIGYSNMPNLTRKISQHNSKVSREARMEENINNNQVPPQQQELPCNCDFVRLEVDECPLLGRCRGGMHKGPFKIQHQKQRRKKQNQTGLSHMEPEGPKTTNWILNQMENY